MRHLETWQKTERRLDLCWIVLVIVFPSVHRAYVVIYCASRIMAAILNCGAATSINKQGMCHFILQKKIVTVLRCQGGEVGQRKPISC